MNGREVFGFCVLGGGVRCRPWVGLRGLWWCGAWGVAGAWCLWGEWRGERERGRKGLGVMRNEAALV